MVAREPVLSDSALRWLECILTERFGAAMALEPQETCEQGCARSISLSIPGAEGRILFTEQLAAFHAASSTLPCSHWDPVPEGFQSAINEPLPAPGLSNLNRPLIEWSADGPSVRYDILGLVYWMLTRLEEVDRADLDEHDRFPAKASHAYQNGYLDRPIVDEWLHVLGQIIKRQWPDITLKAHSFEMKVSHDVDRPTRYGYETPRGLIRTMAGDILKRADFTSAILAPWIRMNSRHQLHPSDPYNTFEWIMDKSDANGLISAFYFICGRTHPVRDAQYDPDDAPIRRLMSRIHQRGHEIGLHPSFNTYKAPDQIRQESETLRRICDEENIKQSYWGGRMHYLRWETPTTLNAWDDAGMTYDSTLGYADSPGFRCGTCHEYPAFDPTTQHALSVRVRPLIAMECSVLSGKYMGLNYESAIENLKLLKSRVALVGGDFTLLWHNSELTTKAQLDLYASVVTSKR